MSAVDRSAAQRFGWIDAVRPQVVTGEPVRGALPLYADGFVLTLPVFRGGEAARTFPGGAQVMVRAARWFAALPVKLDVHDGGMSLAVRLHQ